MVSLLQPSQRPRVHWSVYVGPFALTAVLGSAMTLSVIQSIVRSNWANSGLPVLIGIALGGLVVGAIFGRAHWLPAPLTHFLAAILGVAWIVNRIGPLFGPALPTWRDQATELLIRSIILARTYANGGSGDDIHLFIATLGVLAYLLGYVTLWMLFRRSWAWWAVLFNASVLLVNLTYASPKPPAVLFFIFVGAALLVLVHQSYQQHTDTWQASLLEYPDLLGWRVVGSGAMVVAALMLVTTLLPTRISSAQVAHVWQRVRDPWMNVQARWDRAFSTINAPANAVGGGFATRSLRLSGARTLGNRLVMEVTTPSFDYWRATAYDRYDGSLSWLNTTADLARATLGLDTSERARTPIAAGADIPFADSLERRVVTQTFTLHQDGAITTLFAATQPISVSVPVLVEHTYMPNDSGAPIPNFSDTSTFSAQRPLGSGASYSVSSLVGNADKATLREAPAEYDEWVGRYLQLPQSLPQRVRDEARRVVDEAGAQNPYDIAEAIQAYLRTLPYDEKIPSPPEDRDGVEYFLFDLKRGYCDYFASAMVIMLRAQGVPACLVSGYAGGVLNTETNRYEVRQNVAHTWPEVYFPGYGWQRFEPTPASYTAVPDRAETREEAAAREQGNIPSGPLGNSAEDLLEYEELERLYRERADQAYNLEAVQEAIRQREAEERRRVLLRTGSIGAGLMGSLLLVLGFMWRNHQLSPAARVYDRILRRARWAGIGPSATATPVEVAAGIARRLPAQHEPLHAVASAYTRERYAPAGDVAPDEVEPAWRALRWPLAGVLLSRLWTIPRRRREPATRQPRYKR